MACEPIVDPTPQSGCLQLVLGFTHPAVVWSCFEPGKRGAGSEALERTLRYEQREDFPTA